MSTFCLDRYPVVLLRPQITYPYAWVGHIPFAYLLVDLLQPRTLVELGTDSGNSYLAFCQAIKHLNLSTHAVAVDSWEGDPHARFYGEKVYETLKSYHDARYAGFSRLHRAWFDDAVGTFEDASIDLLHIDGLHTYDAVRHDFETWLPKLSDQAVVIFHDSQVRDRDFGVWKLAMELREKYRCFEFFHSNGLFVVEVGKNPPPAFESFMTYALDNSDPVRAYFEAVAATIVDEASDTPVQSGAVPRNVECKLYFRNAHEGYDEARSYAISSGVSQGLIKFEFQIPAEVSFDFLRIDPADVPCVVGLRELFLVQEGQRINLADPARIRGIDGRELPAKDGEWFRLVALHSDPHVEIELEGVRSQLDKAKAVILEMMVDYEVALVEPQLVMLAHASAAALDESRTDLSRHWGYAAIKQQIDNLRNSIPGSEKLNFDSVNKCLDQLSVQVDKLTSAQAGILGALGSDAASWEGRLSDLSSLQDRAQQELSGRIAALLQHVDQLAMRQSDATGVISQHVDQLARQQSDATSAISQYFDQLTRQQSDMKSIISQHVDQLAQGQSDASSLISRHFDQLTQRHSDASGVISQNFDQLAQRQSDVSSVISRNFDQLAQQQSGVTRVISQHFDQMAQRQSDAASVFAQHVDQLKQQQAGATDVFMQQIQALDLRLGALTRQQENVNSDQQERLEKIFARLEFLANRTWGARVKRLLAWKNGEIQRERKE